MRVTDVAKPSAAVARPHAWRWVAGTTLGALVCTHAIAVAMVAVVLWWFAEPVPGWGPMVAFAALALVMGVMPIQPSRTNVHVTLGLPFIAGLAVACGPMVAILGDVATGLTATLLVAWRRRERLSASLLAANASISAISAGAAALAVYPIWHASAPTAWTWFLAGAGFAGMYVIVNFLLFTHLDALIHGRDFQDNVLAKLRAGGLVFLVGTVATGLLAMLAGQSEWDLAALTLVPLLAARHALAHKARLYERYDETLVALMMMLHRAHPYTHGHLDRVSVLTERVGAELGLGSRRARMLREAAVLHDIGKIAVDERILEKPGTLTDAEFEHVRQHAQFGAEILAQSRQFAPMVSWILSHHERPDGGGYPTGLSGGAIPLESKIIAVTDAFDAMVGGAESGERRPYREPMTVHEALAELRRCAGSQFDQRVVEAFAEVLDREGGY